MKLNKNLLLQNVIKTIESDISEGKVNDVGIKIAQAGEVLVEKYFCNAKEDSIFRLASMSKPITAVATLICAERGLLDIDDKISKYYPGFAEMYVCKCDDKGGTEPVGKASREITVRDLLRHSSGLGSDECGCREEGKLLATNPTDLQTITQGYTGCMLGFDTGTQGIYSGIAGFTILSAIVEKVSGQKYSLFLKENIFDPCEMTDTLFAPSKEQWNRVVDMHIRSQEGKAGYAPRDTEHTFGMLPLTLEAGAASLVGTVRDYFNFAQMLLNKGEYKGRRILGEKFIDMMATAQLPFDIPGTCSVQNWGLGVRTIHPGHPLLPAGCFGWSGAYGTHFWVDPENRIIAVYMKNSGYDGGAGAVTAANFERDIYNSAENA